MGNKVLKFYAPWCEPCKQLSDVFAEANLGLSEIQNINIDIDENREVTSKYRVRSLPTVIMIDEEGNELDRFSGMKTKAEVEQFMNA